MRVPGRNCDGADGKTTGELHRISGSTRFSSDFLSLTLNSPSQVTKPSRCFFQPLWSRDYHPTMDDLISELAHDAQLCVLVGRYQFACDKLPKQYRQGRYPRLVCRCNVSEQSLKHYPSRDKLLSSAT